MLCTPSLVSSQHYYFHFPYEDASEVKSQDRATSAVRPTLFLLMLSCLPPETGNFFIVEVK